MRWLKELDQLAIKKPDKLWTLLWEESYNGKIKLWLTQILLSYRRRKQYLFLNGDYIPLDTTGIYKNNVLAYARKFKNSWLIVVVPLYLTVICKSDKKMIRKID